MKKNARKALAAGNISSTGVYPGGIGGVVGSPCYTFNLGDYRVFISDTELQSLLDNWRTAARDADCGLVFRP
jgi:hypothetical protein